MNIAAKYMVYQRLVLQLRCLQLGGKHRDLYFRGVLKAVLGK